MGAVRFTTASVLLELCSTVDTLSYSVPTGSPLSDLPQPEPVLAQQDHALHSLSFFPPPNSLRPGNEHGFVLARIIEDGYTLELRWIAFTTGQGHGAGGAGGGGKGKGKAELDGPPALPPVRFVFPARLVPDPTLSIRTGDEPSLEVLALTEAGYLYALSFPADSLFYDPALQNEQWSEEFSIDALQHRVPVLVHAVDEGRLVIGSSDGHVLSVEVLEGARRPRWCYFGRDATAAANAFFPSPDGGLTELELRPATSFSVRSLLPSFSTRTNSSNNLSNSSPTQLLSLSSAPGLSFAFGVTRDRKLKVWNLDTGACLKAIDLPKPAKLASSMLVDSDSPGPKAITTLLPPTPRPFVKVVRGDDTALFLVLFTPGAAFVVYAITTDAAGAVSELNLVGEQACGPATGTLVDFQLAQFSPAGVTDAWTLWTLWEEGSASEVRFVPVPELGGASATDDENVWTVVDPGPSGVTAQWNAGHFDELLRDDPEKGVTATFVEHVFYPGRYPPATLEYAIAVYEDALLAETTDPHSRPEALTFEYPSVSERIAAVVGCSVQLDVSPQTGAVLYDSYTKRLKGEWLRFVAIANESRTAALFPLALSVSPERGAALVVMRDAVAVPIVQDTVRVLQDLDPDSRTAFLALPPHALEATYPHLAPRDIRQDLFTILDAIGTLSRALSSTAARELELELVAKVRTPFAAHVEDVAIELYEGSLEPYVTADVRDAVNEQLGILFKAEASFQALWTLLTTPEVVKPLVSKRTAPPSDLASALLTDAVAVSIEARYRLVGGLATLLLFICGDSTASGLLPDPASLTSGTLATLHTLASLRWVAQQAAAPLPPPPSSADDSILERFDSLNVTRDVDSPDAPTVASFSLLNGLLRDPAYSPPLSLSSPLASSLTGGVSTFLDRTGLIIHKRLVVDSPGDVRFAKGLQERGLPDLALEFAELYPKGTGMLYVMGKAYVDLGRWEEAVKAFERAAPALCAFLPPFLSVFENPSFHQLIMFLTHFFVIAQTRRRESASTKAAASRTSFPATSVPGSAGTTDTSSTSLRPTVSTSPSSSLLHSRLMRWKRREEGPTRTGRNFGGCSSRAMPLWDYGRRRMSRSWRCRLPTCTFFPSCLSVALRRLTTPPSPDSKSTSLAYLVSVMCENGQVELLTRWSFIGLQSELESILNFRARNSDPTAVPNYYRILYAYHVAKGDYRSGALSFFFPLPLLGNRLTREVGC